MKITYFEEIKFSFDRLFGHFCGARDLYFQSSRYPYQPGLISWIPLISIRMCLDHGNGEVEWEYHYLFCPFPCLD